MCIRDRLYDFDLSYRRWQAARAGADRARRVGASVRAHRGRSGNRVCQAVRRAGPRARRAR